MKKHSLILLLSIIGIFIISMYTITQRQTILQSDSWKIEFIGEYQDNNGQWHSLQQEALPEKHLDILHLRGRFRPSLEENELLHVYIRYLEVEINEAGKTRFRYGQPGTYPEIMKSAGVSWGMLSFPDNPKNIEITLKNHYPHTNNHAYQAFLNNFYVGDSWGLAMNLLHQDTLLIGEGIVLLHLGLFLIGSALLLKRYELEEQLQKLLFFGLYLIVSGIWILVNGQFSTLLVNNSMFLMVLDTLLQMSLLMFFISYLLQFTEDRTRKFLQGLRVVCGGLLLLMMAVQVSGIMDAYMIKSLLIPFTLGAAIVIICLVVHDLWKNKERKQWMLAAMMLYSIFIIGEGIDYYADAFSTGKILATGLFIFVLMQGIGFIKSMMMMLSDAQKAAVYEKQLTENKIAIMLSQIQPHFLYNALNTIHYLTKTDPNLAAATIEKFSKYLRGNLDALKQKTPVSLQQELDHLDNYVTIEALRFPQIQMTYDLAASDLVLPVLTLQPLVENAIKHGIRKKKGAGKIQITATEDEENFYLTVTDDGIGFDTEQPLDDKRSHIGLKNVKERVENLMGGHVEVDSRIGEGTKINIVLPKSQQRSEKNERSLSG